MSRSLTNTLQLRIMSYLLILLNILLLTQPSGASLVDYFSLRKDAFTERTEEPAKAPVRTRPISNNVFRLPETSMIVTNMQNVVGGTPAAANDFPYHVLFNSGTNVCSGVLIHPDIVLTTVSCTAAQNSNALIGGISSTGFDSVVRTVERLVEHPDYDSVTMENDLMIVKLTETTDITPVRLGTAVPIDGTGVTALGFGLTSDDGDAADTLQRVDISVLNFNTCENLLDDQLFPNSQICAGDLEDGRGHCQQDEGGALLSGSTLVGLFSFNDDCGEVNEPSIYTSVSAYLDFIEATICDISSVPPEDCDSAAPSISLAPSRSPAPTADATVSNRPTTTTDALPSFVPSSQVTSEESSLESNVPTMVATTLAPSKPFKSSSKKSKKSKKGKKRRRRRNGKGGKGSSSGKGGKGSYSGKGGKGSSSGKGGKGSSSGKGGKRSSSGKGGKRSSRDNDYNIVSTQNQPRGSGTVPLYTLTREQRRRRRRRRQFGM